ncbi:hypothetical protein SUNI508_10062 [Seiridium unicorne]|uniref:Uncharacterized protein n=1 Tax=Seiridium unicorne TaxID=138068 RepID=A0ABR2UN60_9PEZI
MRPCTRLRLRLRLQLTLAACNRGKRDSAILQVEAPAAWPSSSLDVSGRKKGLLPAAPRPDRTASFRKGFELNRLRGVFVAHINGDRQSLLFEGLPVARCTELLEHVHRSSTWYLLQPRSIAFTFTPSLRSVPSLPWRVGTPRPRRNTRIPLYLALL